MDIFSENLLAKEEGFFEESIKLAQNQTGIHWSFSQSYQILE